MAIQVQHGQSPGIFGITALDAGFRQGKAKGDLARSQEKRAADRHVMAIVESARREGDRFRNKVRQDRLDAESAADRAEARADRAAARAGGAPRGFAAEGAGPMGAGAPAAMEMAAVDPVPGIEGLDDVMGSPGGGPLAGVDAAITERLRFLSENKFLPEAASQIEKLRSHISALEGDQLNLREGNPARFAKEAEQWLKRFDSANLQSKVIKPPTIQESVTDGTLIPFGPSGPLSDQEGNPQFDGARAVFSRDKKTGKWSKLWEDQTNYRELYDLAREDLGYGPDLNPTPEDVFKRMGLFRKMMDGSYRVPVDGDTEVLDASIKHRMGEAIDAVVNAKDPEAIVRANEGLQKIVEEKRQFNQMRQQQPPAEGEGGGIVPQQAQQMKPPAQAAQQAAAPSGQQPTAQIRAQMSNEYNALQRAFNEIRNSDPIKAQQIRRRMDFLRQQLDQLGGLQAPKRLGQKPSADPEPSVDQPQTIPEPQDTIELVNPTGKTIEAKPKGQRVELVSGDERKKLLTKMRAEGISVVKLHRAERSARELRAKYPKLTPDQLNSLPPEDQEKFKEMMEVLKLRGAK